MNLLSVNEASERLDARLKEHGGSMSRDNFVRTIIPLMANPRRNEAVQVDRKWVIDGKDFWQWEVYAETRQRLISEGTWIARRPWSIADLEDIATDLIDYDEE